MEKLLLLLTFVQTSFKYLTGLEQLESMTEISYLGELSI